MWKASVCGAVVLVTLLLPALSRGQEAPEKSLDELIADLEGPDQPAREAAIGGLYEHAAKHGELAVPRLIRALAHDDQRVRGAAAVALGRVRSTAARSLNTLLLVATTDPDATVAGEAMNALMLIGPRPGDVDVLFQLALQARRSSHSGDDRDERGDEAEFALCRLNQRGRVGLIKWLRAKSPDARQLAGELLEWSVHPEVVAGLARALDDPERHVRLSVMNSFGGPLSQGLGFVAGGGRVAVNRLVAFTESGDPQEQRAATKALSRLGTPEAVAALTGLLLHSDQEVRGEAALGLASARDPACIPILIESLGHSDKEIRSDAVWTLAGLGAVAEPALPALAALPRRESSQALSEIGKQLKLSGVVVWWVPLRAYALETAGLLVFLGVWLGLAWRLLPILVEKIRGLRLIVVSSVLTTLAACVTGYAFLPERAWWKEPGILVLFGLALFLPVFLCAGKLVRSPSPTMERVAWIGLVASIPTALAGFGIHHVFSQPWVQGYLPDSLFVVLPLPLAAMGSVAICCVLPAIWVCTKRAARATPLAVDEPTSGARGPC
ncbi:MAG: HEAT repeat domain-containing protein [Planctomycetes bacterium]|nr:HEAT repeat domain-containing protein [Planctomycetota bacterium]